MVSHKKSSISLRPLKILSLIGAIVFTLPWAFLVVDVPEDGWPLYAKMVGFGVFFALIYISLLVTERKRGSQANAPRADQ
ncbi:MAG: hypothetical protein ACOCVG_04360 [Verrucomicrobiota bacterium]